VIADFSRAINRWRYLVAAVALAGTLAGVAAGLRAPGYRGVIYPSMLGAVLLVFPVSLIMANVVNRCAPHTLDIVADGFETPQHGYGALITISWFPAIGIVLAVSWDEAASGRHPWIGSIGAAAAVGLLGWLIRLLRTVPRLRFTSTGIQVTRLTSALVVPWEALNRHRPVARDAVPLSLVIVRPDLVERRGRTAKSNWIAFDGANIAFVVAAISHYAAHPEHRGAIGTPAELDRLRAALPAPPGVPLMDRPTREPGVTRAGVVSLVVFLIGGVALETATKSWWLEIPGQVVAVAAGFGLARSVHLITWIRQRLAAMRLTRQRPDAE